MNKKLIINILAGVVALAGIIVILGWVFDIQSLKSILPMWVTMKFMTAVSFILCSIIIFIINSENNSEMLHFSLIISSFVLLLLMVTFFVSLIVGISTGIENIFIPEDPNPINTHAPGVPAVPTMICFILISLSGLFFSLNINKIILFYLGLPTALLGSIAIIGYILNIPSLYYSFLGLTAMAFHTAILFVLLGISLIVLGRYK